MTSDDRWARQLDTDTRSPLVGVEASTLLVPGLTVFWHVDPCRVGEQCCLPELAFEGRLALSRLGPLFAQPGEPLRRPLADAHLSRRPIHLRSDRDGNLRFELAKSVSSLRIDGLEVMSAEIPEIPSARLDGGVVLVLAERVGLLLHRMMPMYPRQPRLDLVGESAAIVEVRRHVQRVAASDVPVLLRGETGTGKELVARAIHEASRRRGQPYLAVNVGAIPPSLAPSELFGALRGAFTGADRARAGFFQRCDGGTLFLDEVGDMPAAVQPMLLRTLESGEVQPVGSTTPSKVDVRVVAATDSNLEDDIDAGRFRAPLLHRLGGYQIELPPLRARRDDVGRLLLFFLRRELEALGVARRLRDPGPDGAPWLSAARVARLVAHDWPGNVRQLLNVARRLAIEAGDEEMVDDGLAERLLPAPVARSEVAAEGRAAEAKRYRSPEDVSDEEIERVLAEQRWRVLPAARALGMSRTALYRRVESSSVLRTAAQLDAAEIEACHRRCRGDLGAMIDELRVSRKGLSRRLRKLGLR